MINLGTAEQLELPSKKTNQPLHAGDTLSMFISGGGGFGDPRQRDPELVARDVAEGWYRSRPRPATTRVIVDPVSFKVDAEATAKLRAGEPRPAVTA